MNLTRSTFRSIHELRSLRPAFPALVFQLGAAVGLLAATAGANGQTNQRQFQIPAHGLYEDFRAQTSEGGLWFPDYDREGRPVPGSGKRFARIDVQGALQVDLLSGTNASVSGLHYSNSVIHILASELTEPLVREALTNGHFYLANDRLGDTAGFMFGAVNNLGLFTMGDTAPMAGKTRAMAVTPVTAKLRLMREGQVVLESSGTNLNFEVKEPGRYRLEVRLTADGEDRLWIASHSVNLRAPDFRDMRLPSMAISPEVEAHKGITYWEGPEADAEKHKLDVYAPKGGTNAPVCFFIHGGAWKSGDRSLYPPVGNRYARAGYVTVVPSYRLAPKHPHPAQIEDVAAAFAWTVRHVGEYGGDTNRIYVAGHSAGGHLAALLTLDEQYLAAYGLSSKNIRAVLGLSGVYNLSVGDFQDSVFGKDPEARRAASPLFHVKAGAPPFLVEYCEWDYFTLPAQARQFQRALKKAGVSAELVYIPAQSHISEMFSFASDHEPMAAAALKFMK